mgnify:CR=1 FL=1
MNEIDSNLINSFEKIAIKAMFKAGQIALNFQNNKIKFWYKSKSQPVTHADIEINTYLQNFFKKNTPDFGWLSEEVDDDESILKKEMFWCLDPIDGTRSYIDGKPEFVISLALIYKDFPILGLIYNPRTKEMFSARKGSGSYCNNEKIKVSQNMNLNNCKITISSSEIAKTKKYQFLKNQKLITMGSIAYKVALVAKGKVDIAISFTGKSDWDLAAASLILEESGGTISNLDGKKINYNTSTLRIPSVCATNTKTHNKILNEIKMI